MKPQSVSSRGNFIRFSPNRWFLFCLTVTTALFHSLCIASEYEVDGKISQAIQTYTGNTLHATASFTVYVRGCSWLIQTTETNEIGGVTRREVGSTNGYEIYECEQPVGRTEPVSVATNDTLSGKFIRSSERMFATIVSNNLPVGDTDSAVVGHLWLIFASQCYWPGVETDQLTPVYDWHASVAARGQGLKVTAGWDLLEGPRPLPRRVWYLGHWGETNGLYSITGTNSIGGMLIPTGFIFEQFQIGALKDNSFVHEIVVAKRVVAEVTGTRPNCSKIELIPSPKSHAVVIDRRFDSGLPNRPPSYQNPVDGQWPSIEKSKQFAAVQRAIDLKNLVQDQGLAQKQLRSSAHRQRVVLIIMCIFLFAPPLIYFTVRAVGNARKTHE